MRSRLLAAGALAIVLVTAGCAGAFAGAPAESGRVDSTPNDAVAATTPNDPEEKQIRVGAAGKVRTTPDRAVVRVGVEVTAADAATAREQLAENVSSVRDALLEMGLEKDQISTAHFDIDQRRERPEPRSKEKPRVRYQARHSLRITLTRLNRTGDVIVTAIESGATEVDNVDFTISEGTRRELRQRALTDAMESARRQAGTIAESSESLSAGSLAVQSVRTTEVDFDFRRGDGGAVLEATPTAGAGGAPTSIEGGQVTVTARVVVNYNTTA